MGGFVGAVSAANRRFRRLLEETPVGEEFLVDEWEGMHLMVAKTKTGATIRNLKTGEEETLEFKEVWSGGGGL